MSLQTEVGRPQFNLQLLGARLPDSDDQTRKGGGRRGQTGVAQQRILLVEDDRGIRNVLGTILEEHGYVVTAVGNGRQALHRLQTRRAPDLIILDLRMPVMDGWQFRAAQKADPTLAEIPVLALSADGSAQAEAIDAAAYIRKPLSTDVLLGTVRRILANDARKQLWARLEEAERFAAVGRLAASIGHQIDKPLAYVSLNLDVLASQIKRYFDDHAEALVALPAVPLMFNQCRGSLNRTREVVKGLQTLSVKSGVTRERLSLNELLDQSLEIARIAARYRATVRKEYGDIPPVVGERSALGQVFLNLILNAAHALPAGRADGREITLRTYVVGDHVTAEVRDQGVGIAAEMLPHIFDPFFTTKATSEGIGLGLSVAFQIVAEHQGRIDVDTKVGEGSSFRVVLPAAPLEPPETVPGEGSDSPQRPD
jgi:signal transduction histidine kinase